MHPRPRKGESGARDKYLMGFEEFFSSRAASVPGMASQRSTDGGDAFKRGDGIAVTPAAHNGLPGVEGKLEIS